MRDKFLAALMLNGANAAKYNELKRGMAENYVIGTSEYPAHLECLPTTAKVEREPTQARSRGQNQ